jgi:hypothetical protein
MMMRGLCAVAGLCMMAHAKALPAQSADHEWQLAVVGAGIRFTGGSVLLAPGAEGAEFRPNQRLGLGAGLVRRLGLWEAGLEAGVANGHPELEGRSLSVEQKALDVRRYRAALALSHRLVKLGAAEIAAGAAGTIDLWQVETADSRTRLGGEARLALRVPAGRWLLENMAAYGWSSSPWRQDELTVDYELRTLKTLTFAAGLRYRL